MSNKPTGVIAGALLALVSAVTVLLNVFGITHWTDAQTAAVTAEAATSVALIGAAYAHFRKGTSKEPAILLGALSAWLTRRTHPYRDTSDSNRSPRTLIRRQGP